MNKEQKEEKKEIVINKTECGHICAQSEIIGRFTAELCNLTLIIKAYGDKIDRLDSSITSIKIKMAYVYGGAVVLVFVAEWIKTNFFK
jgi:hypothetical protein